jgi:uncharacterized membrane protein
MSKMQARLLGHPLHPMVLHFPIGLLAFSTLAEIITVIAPSFSEIAHTCLIAGLIAAVPAALTGLIDSTGVPRTKEAERALTRHLTLMLAALTAYGAVLLVRGVWAIAISALGALLLAIGGWYGGELTYRHRAGATEDHSVGVSVVSSKR